MKTSWKTWGGALLLVSFFASPLTAEEATAPARGGARIRHRGRGVPRFGRGDDPAKVIEMVRMYKMIEVLNLSEEQCQAVFPIISRFNNARRERQEKMEEALHSLRSMVKDENLMEAKYTEKVQELREQTRIQRVSEDKMLDELLPHLSPKQQAQFILFHHDFERRMRELIEKVRDPNASPARPGGPPQGLRGQRNRLGNPDHPDELPPPVR